MWRKSYRYTPSTDTALEMLLDAVAAELEVRGYEDAEYKVAQASANGECMAVVRPDRQEGYAPTE